MKGQVLGERNKTSPSLFSRAAAHPGSSSTRDSCGGVGGGQGKCHRWAPLSSLPQDALCSQPIGTEAHIWDSWPGCLGFTPIYRRPPRALRGTRDVGWRLQCHKAPAVQSGRDRLSGASLDGTDPLFIHGGQRTDTYQPP